MTINWATFTSFKHGDHNICICEDLEQVMEVIDATTLPEDEIVIMNYKDKDQIRAKLETLKMSDNIWIQWEDTTWMTVQRMSPTEEELEEIVDYVIERRQRAKYT